MAETAKSPMGKPRDKDRPPRRGPIGVLDSGVGGLTVVRELERLLPDEDIIYYGDNIHCPYGNRTEEDIVRIGHGTIGFLRDQGVKAVVLACNTTSSLIDRIQPDFDFPIFSIIAPVAREVAASGLRSVGVIATEITIRSGSYGRLIQAEDPAVSVFGEPSHHLARLVDCGAFRMDEIDAEVREHLDRLLGEHPEVEAVIYGCTHYPIVAESFERAAPGMRYLNPAEAQVLEVRRLLEERGLRNDRAGRSLELYTTGGEAAYPAYRTVLDRLGVAGPVRFHSL